MLRQDDAPDTLITTRNVIFYEDVFEPSQLPLNPFLNSFAILSFYWMMIHLMMLGELTPDGHGTSQDAPDPSTQPPQPPLSRPPLPSTTEMVPTPSPPENVGGTPRSVAQPLPQSSPSSASAPAPVITKIGGTKVGGTVKGTTYARSTKSSAAKSVPPRSRSQPPRTVKTSPAYHMSKKFDEHMVRRMSRALFFWLMMRRDCLIF
jgi:hypothetical protein